jgi:hypothetical protein
MLRISNVQTYGLEESIIASGYPKRVDLPIDMDIEKVSTLENEFNNISKDSAHFKRVEKLGASPSNSGHGNYLTGIVVQFDVTYPAYWSMQFQRYHFIQIISSQSKMHKLAEMDYDEYFNEYVNMETKDNIKYLKNKYNSNPTYDNYMTLLSNCPMGLEMTMRISTNYMQLKTIYQQRKNHKLKEDWGAFCEFVLSLPYFKELTGIE